VRPWERQDKAGPFSAQRAKHANPEGRERVCRRSRKNGQNVAVNTVSGHFVLHRMVFRHRNARGLMKTLLEKHFFRENSLLRARRAVLQKYDKRGDFIIEERQRSKRRCKTLPFSDLNIALHNRFPESPMKPITTLVAAGLLAAAGATSALAEDNAFDVAFGVGVANNYISRGATQSSDQPIIDGYMEATYGIVYGGVWASRVKTGTDSVEIDVYGGIRPEFGQLSLDLGYARYFYNKSGNVNGEFYGKASFALTDDFSFGGDVYWDPTAKTNWVVAKAEFSGLPYDISFSGSVGSDFGTQNLGSDKIAWDAGFSRGFVDDTVTLDLRYYDSNKDPARFVVRLAFDTSFSALKK